MSALLEVQDLSVHYVVPGKRVRAVDHVSFSIQPGEIMGLAGESGCGKSTTAHAVLRILRPPARIAGGRVLFKGQDLVPLNVQDLRQFRWRHISLVFQSAMNALNPVLSVGDQFVDMMQAHEPIDKDEALKNTGDLLELVGIDRQRVNAYPHELSGGMRQRVVIAMALALKPELIVMDEPTTALDVVVQRQILQEIAKLQKQLQFAVLFITHDLSLLVEFSNRIAVMYAGEVVESAPSRTMFEQPSHPYTVGLMSSFPALDGREKDRARHSRLTARSGQPALGMPLPPRCSHCTPDNPQLYALQTKVKPVLKEIDPDHLVACHLFGDDHGR